MSKPSDHGRSLSDVNSDDVRVLRQQRSSAALRRWIVPVLAIAALSGAYCLLPDTNDRSTSVAAIGDAIDSNQVKVVTIKSAEVKPATRLRVMPIRPVVASTNVLGESDADFTAPNQDADDLASYFKPGDAEPTMAELIDALRESGVKTGIAAFNPPGTSPSMVGLAVPPDFELPAGYVRHHQVTDQGEDIEPILIFAPDVQLFDEHGQPVAIPENRVVPPELAPPGLPIREIIVPPAQS